MVGWCRVIAADVWCERILKDTYFHVVVPKTLNFLARHVIASHRSGRTYRLRRKLVETSDNAVELINNELTTRKENVGKRTLLSIQQIFRIVGFARVYVS